LVPLTIGKDKCLLGRNDHHLLQVTRKEWRYARQRGVCVYPVKGALDGAVDDPSLAKWISKSHFFDLEREWDTFIHHLKSPCRVCVYPVKGASDDAVDDPSLAKWISKSHFFDLEREWDTFIHHLKSPCHAGRVRRTSSAT